jgi:dipeptidyl aminopeptidase/acylaminoacyl peptidase
MRRTALALVAVVAATADAQEPYRTPSPAIAALVDAPQTPTVLLSPDRQTALVAEIPRPPPISEVAEAELRLAGLRVNPRSNGRGHPSYLGKLSFLDLRTRALREVAGLPAAPRVLEPEFSPDGKRLAFILIGDDGLTLWQAEVAGARAKELSATRLNGVVGDTCRWLPDSQGLICRAIVRGAAEPPADPAPTGPVVLENDGRRRPVRTNPDLLKSPRDEALLEHYLAAQIVRIGVDGQVVPVGKPGLITRAEPSPDGAHLLVSTVHRPYSYRVPIERFPHRTEVWTGAASVLLADTPLADAVSVRFSAVAPGPRDHAWRADADATVCWAEARDGGDPATKADIRDELRCLAAPFRADATRLIELPYRFDRVLWGTGQLALVTESWWDTRRTRTYVVAPDAPGTPRVLWDRSSEDRYSDPGTPFLRATARGTRVLQTTPSGALLLRGAGASTEGDRPFVDRLDLASGTSTRLWRSAAPTFEMAIGPIDDAGDRLLTRREAVAEPPQYFLRTVASGKLEPLTHFPHPTPSLAKVQRELIHYKRNDGVELSGTLYLPPGWTPKQGRLPVLLWAYPHEFKSAGAASQVTDSPYRFARISTWGPQFALLLGFAVLDDPRLPIVGEGSAEPNDTYVAQLVAGARAAVDELVRRGVADADRLAIGGHSYGAFTTANLLAHTDLFRAGIARSGAYNRTLTPFSFQSEERTFWQAPETYIEMSPFTHAEKIDEPLLLIHGQVDNNEGTFPIQSERLFEALSGLGGRVRLVLLPAEQHGYRARESLLHMLWEEEQWLDKQVKSAPPRRATR